jgi:radical SAM superfamily enzyme
MYIKKGGYNMIAKTYQVKNDELWVLAKENNSEYEVEKGEILNIIVEPYFNYLTEKEVANQKFLGFVEEYHNNYNNLNDLRAAWKSYLKQAALSVLITLKEATDLDDNEQMLELIEDFNYHFKQIRGW